METPQEIILLLHGIHKEIPEREAIHALPDPWKALPRHVVVIRPDSFSLSEAGQSYWPGLMDIQKQQFEEVLAPLLAEKNEALILYFGAAPIPLSIHLGSLIGNWRKVRIALQDHVSNDWMLLLPEKDTPSQAITIKGLTEAPLGGQGDVVLRIATSYAIQPHQTDFVQLPLRTIDIAANAESPDLFTDFAVVSELVKHYLEALQCVTDHMSQARLIHLFAAVPVGIAFLLGKHINPNVVAKIQTYQFKSDTGYTPAFTIPGTPAAAQLSVEEAERIQQLRFALEQHRAEKLNPYIQNIDLPAKQGWYGFLKLTKAETAYFQGEFWAKLTPLPQTQLPGSRLDTSRTLGDQFYDEGKWIFPDAFLHPLSQRIEADTMFRAIRMFWFHETLHHSLHRLTSLAALAIGAFPKVVEEADYQADVYAMLHEYGYARLHHAQEVSDVADFFGRMVHTALETMWAFDASAPSNEMQVRRFNRYMIWHYQAVRLSDPSCKTLAHVLRILTTKPIIELAGLRTLATSNGRVVYSFANLQPAKLELSLFLDNRVARQSRHADGLPLEDLVAGCRARDSGPILTVLRTFRDRIQP